MGLCKKSIALEYVMTGAFPKTAALLPGCWISLVTVQIARSLTSRQGSPAPDTLSSHDSQNLSNWLFPRCS
ncbi:MAG: hypothetical protein OJF50_004136 [Nitrospira sp.]|nr:hypothetical protein [Nitrospira sp.]